MRSENGKWLFRATKRKTSSCNIVLHPNIYMHAQYGHRITNYAAIQHITSVSWTESHETGTKDISRHIPPFPAMFSSTFHLYIGRPRHGYPYIHTFLSHNNVQRLLAHSDPRGDRGAVRLQLPLPAGLPAARQLDAERWSGSCPSCASRLRPTGGHHEPLLPRAHIRAADGSLVGSRQLLHLECLLC